MSGRVAASTIAPHINNPTIHRAGRAPFGHPCSFLPGESCWSTCTSGCARHIVTIGRIAPHSETGRARHTVTSGSVIPPTKAGYTGHIVTPGGTAPHTGTGRAGHTVASGSVTPPTKAGYAGHTVTSGGTAPHTETGRAKHTVTSSQVVLVTHARVRSVGQLLTSQNTIVIPSGYFSLGIVFGG